MKLLLLLILSTLVSCGNDKGLSNSSSASSIYSANMQNQKSFEGFIYFQGRWILNIHGVEFLLSELSNPELVKVLQNAEQNYITGQKFRIMVKGYPQNAQGLQSSAFVTLL